MHIPPVLPLNLATLTWLDRRRVAVAAPRHSALGVSPTPMAPTLVGGQAARPGFAHRRYAPALFWALAPLLLTTGLGALLGATIAVVWAATL